MKKVQYVLELVGLSEFEDNMRINYGGQQKVGLAEPLLSQNTFFMMNQQPLNPVMSTNIENVMVRLNEVMNITSIVVHIKNRLF